MVSERLGERLRAAREQARLTQADAAGAIGVSAPALNQYEAGKRRVDALMLDRLSRLYAVPLTFFFEGQVDVPDWERALRLKLDGLSTEAKTGILHLVERIRALEELYRRTGSPFPGRPHPPFPPLGQGALSEDEIAQWAEKTRRHFDLGMAPIPELRSFLEAQGYQFFAVSLGRGEDALAGLFFIHPDLGPIVALNVDQAYTRRPFTMAHEFAHGLFHYDRPAILCRAIPTGPVERFAESFASQFLVPREALIDRLHALGTRVVSRAEDVVHLARYFGVSYGAMLRRLKDERRLSGPAETFDVRPVALARSLGYLPSDFEFGARPLPPEERLPRIFVEMAYQVVRDGQLSLRRVATMLGISDIELEERLSPEFIAEPIEAYA